MAAFTQFGSDLDKATIRQLERGKRLSELLKQNEGVPLDVEHQILTIYAGTNGFLDQFTIDAVKLFEEKLLDYVEKTRPDILREIRKEKILSTELRDRMKEVLEEFCDEFKTLYPAKVITDNK